jgi:hypothetical protein
MGGLLRGTAVNIRGRGAGAGVGLYVGGKMMILEAVVHGGHTCELTLHGGCDPNPRYSWRCQFGPFGGPRLSVGVDMNTLVAARDELERAIAELRQAGAVEYPVCTPGR